MNQPEARPGAMSLRGRHHGERPRFEQTFGALLAALAIAAPAPPAPAQNLAPVNAPTREALPPLEKKARAVKPIAGKPQRHRDDPKGWRFYRDGALDPCNNYRAYPKLRRLLISQLFEVEGARQWIKLDRELRRRAPDFASLPVPRLFPLVLRLAALHGRSLEL